MAPSKSRSATSRPMVDDENSSGYPTPIICAHAEKAKDARAVPDEKPMFFGILRECLGQKDTAETAGTVSIGANHPR